MNVAEKELVLEPITRIPTDRVVIDPQLQPRVGGIDPDHVRTLEAVAEHWPPLKLVIRGERYVLVDGYHRYAAAKNLKLQTVPVEVLKVSETEDLHSLAFALNAAHGRPLTLSDRRAFAARLLCSHPDWSDREIGRRCGLVQPTIAKVRHELESRGAIQEAKSRVGGDGRSYVVTPKKNLKEVPLVTLFDNLADVLDTSGQRKIVRYLIKLSDVLAEQSKLKSFKTFDDAAQACRKVLGEKRANELAERLGWSSLNIFEIARALGYRKGDQP